jgi:glycosyltransferase involved in cell wall biosynthesis
VPAVSVLLPVRNASTWLGASLASLWRQSFTDFEVVAVDDGSTDGSGELLERAARREPRLRVIHTPHRGLPRAIAAAHRHARAPLLARHDADDLSHRERFALQVAFLRAHPRVAVLGTRLRLFPAGAVRPGMRRWVEWHNALLEHQEMAREVLVESPLAHGTALLRRRWVERVGGWTDRGWPEDLDLWIRLLEAGARFAKLPRALYGWRQHAASATWQDPAFSRERVLALKYDALARGLLRGRHELTLVGVGASLRAESAALARRDFLVHALEQGRPATGARGAGRTPPDAPGLRPPVVLVFGASQARQRWRVALTGFGMIEGRDFVFVA